MTERHVTHYVIEYQDRPHYTVQDIPLFLLADSVRRESIRTTLEDERMKRIVEMEKVWDGIKLKVQPTCGLTEDEPQSLAGPKGYAYRSNIYTIKDSEILLAEAAAVAKTTPVHFKHKMQQLGYEVKTVHIMATRGKEKRLARDNRDVCDRGDAQKVILYYQNMKR